MWALLAATIAQRMTLCVYYDAAMVTTTTLRDDVIAASIVDGLWHPTVALRQQRYRPGSNSYQLRQAFYNLGARARWGASGGLNSYDSAHEPTTPYCITSTSVACLIAVTRREAAILTYNLALYLSAIFFSTHPTIIRTVAAALLSRVC